MAPIRLHKAFIPQRRSKLRAGSLGTGKRTTLRPAAGSAGQRRGGIGLPLQTKVIRGAPSAVEVVTAEDIRSFGWRTLANNSEHIQDTLSADGRTARFRLEYGF